jgi:hypothetical protein
MFSLKSLPDEGGEEKYGLEDYLVAESISNMSAAFCTNLFCREPYDCRSKDAPVLLSVMHLKILELRNTQKPNRARLSDE